jgi:hypothetical protein
MYSSKYIFHQIFRTEEEMYYANSSIFAQERSTPQNWQNQAMAALIFFNGLEKEKKKLSLRSP